MRRTLALIILALCPLAAGAQTLVQKADSLLDRHYHRITLHERGTTLDVSALPHGVYLLRLMSDSGFRPELDHCLRCGRRYDQTEGWHFREEEGGLVCPACMGTAQRSLRPGAIAAMRYMIDAPVQKVYKFTISDEIRQQIKQPIRSYTVMNLGMPLKSLAFAENVENMDLKTRPVIDN